MHTEPRAGAINKLVLHTNEGPEGENSAAGLAGYLQRNGPQGGGYQATFDDAHTVVVQLDNVVCWANGGVNHESIDGCIVGYAAQSPAEWADAFDRGAIEQAAQWFAGKCKAYGIPPVRMAPWQVATVGFKGICGHGDVTLAGFAGTAGHTDPGLNFPWDRFLARVAQLVAPPVDWTAIAALAAWKNRVSGHPLAENDRGADVRTMIDLLVAKHFLPPGTGPGDTYGPHCVAAVKKFKIAKHCPNDDGTHFGRFVAAAILKP